jgi:hypothetical protein
MRPAIAVVAAAVVASILAPGAAVAQPSRCAECHFANFADVPGREHLAEWEQSPHARHGVGCEWCHGGDASTFVPGEAHKGVVSSRSPASRVNRANLPQTCSLCHAGEAQAFARSRHAALLTAGDPRAPTCSTCHGVMTARVPAPAALEAACAACHPGDSPGAVYPGRARAAVEAINQVRTQLERVQIALQKLGDTDRRRRLWAEQTLAISTLNGAVDALHAFDFAATDQRLREAKTRADQLQANVR